MELDLLNRAVRTVFDEIPPPIRFGEEDAQAIRKYSRELEAITDELVRGFYDLLYSHPATAAVFKEGERAEREATLRDWWLRTVRGGPSTRGGIGGGRPSLGGLFTSAAA